MLRKFFRKTPLAWLQLRREKMRLVVALAGIAFADVLMLVQMGFEDALYNSATAPYQVLEGDLFLVNPLFDNLNAVRSFRRERLYQAAGVEGVESINSIYIASGGWRNPQNRTNQTAMVWGINPTHPAISIPEIEQYQSELKLLDRVLYDRAGRENLFGDVTKLLEQSNSVSIQFNNFSIKVVGTFTLGASFSADSNLIVSHSTFLRLFPSHQANRIDIGVVNLKSDVNIEQVQASLRSTLPNDVLILTHAEIIEREKKYWQVNSSIGFIFGFGAAIGFIVGAVIVYQILYSDVSDHLPEYATLKAMGYSDRYLITVLIQESLILAVLGFIPGLVLSTGLYSVARAATLLPISMTLSRAVTVLVLTIIMCAASGGIAMRKLQAADPADIF